LCSYLFNYLQLTINSNSALALTGHAEMHRMCGAVCCEFVGVIIVRHTFAVGCLRSSPCATVCRGHRSHLCREPQCAVCFFEVRCVLELCRVLDRLAHSKIIFVVRLLTAKDRRTEEIDFSVVI
jgi:hypothetical protein